jgi:hypothetical protein
MKVDSVDPSANPSCEQLEGSEDIFIELADTLTRTAVRIIIRDSKRLLSRVEGFGKVLFPVEAAILSSCLF